MDGLSRYTIIIVLFLSAYIVLGIIWIIHLSKIYKTRKPIYLHFITLFYTSSLVENIINLATSILYDNNKNSAAFTPLLFLTNLVFLTNVILFYALSFLIAFGFCITKIDIDLISKQKILGILFN